MKATRDMITKMNQGGGGRPLFYFEAPMRTTFGSAFRRCKDNYEVEDLLREVGVLKHNTLTATESGALIVIFTKKDAAYNFIDRLNRFLLYLQNNT